MLERGGEKLGLQKREAHLVHIRMRLPLLFRIRGPATLRRMHEQFDLSECLGAP